MRSSSPHPIPSPLRGGLGLGFGSLSPHPALASEFSTVLRESFVPRARRCPRANEPGIFTSINENSLCWRTQAVVVCVVCRACGGLDPPSHWALLRPSCKRPHFRGGLRVLHRPAAAAPPHHHISSDGRTSRVCGRNTGYQHPLQLLQLHLHQPRRTPCCVGACLPSSAAAKPNRLAPRESLFSE